MPIPGSRKADPGKIAGTAPPDPAGTKEMMVNERATRLHTPLLRKTLNTEDERPCVNELIEFRYFYKNCRTMKDVHSVIRQLKIKIYAYSNR